MRAVFTKSQIKTIDKMAADYLQINSFELMQQAGAAIFSYVHNEKNLLVVTGAGNNAGDGFVMAQLALQRGIKVVVWGLLSIEKLPKDARHAADSYIKSGGQIIDVQPKHKFDCVVDAIFGTGLSRNVEGVFAQAVEWINQQKAKVVSVDIPSGLDADTGCIMACSVAADMTVCVIAFKPGLLTNHGKDICGQLYLEDLEIPNQLLCEFSSQINELDVSVLQQDLFQHVHNSHKGSFGHALIVGGHDGMLGALMLAGRAALRSGCGMVETVTNGEQSVLISLQCPELITTNDVKASRLISSTQVIAIGPGLGLNQESKTVLDYCIKQNKPMVVDADALTLSANVHVFSNDVVLTPHPKEAGTLLDCDVAVIQNDRVSAAIAIAQKYQAVVVLKGSGTVVANPEGKVAICPYGYSGMATAGMGDVLTGIVAGLMAQGFDAFNAAQTAVVWHALAAEDCHKGNGLIASDVIEQLPQTLIKR